MSAGTYKYTAWVEFARSLSNRDQLKDFDRESRKKGGKSYLGMKGRKFYFGFNDTEEREIFIRQLENSLTKYRYRTERVIE